MKIAINTRLLLKNKLEGIGWFSHEILRRIVQHHPDHQFYFIFDRPYDPSFIYTKNVTPFVLYPPARHPSLWYYWFEYALPRLLKKISPDVFFSPDGFLPLNTKCPKVAVIHDLNFHYHPEGLPWLIRKYYNHFFPMFAQKAHHIFTVSEFSKQSIVEAYNVNAAKVSVVYNAPHSSYRPLTTSEKKEIKANISAGADYFLFVGAISPRKNLIRLIKAFLEFKKQNLSGTKLVIAGSIMHASLGDKKVFASGKTNPDLIFTGHLPQDTLSKVMGAALALCFPSTFEGFGIPLVEAMQSHVPIMASHATCIPEICHASALYFDPLSVESMTNAFTEIFLNEGLRHSLVENGKKQKEEFSWDESASIVWDLLEKIASDQI